MRFLVLTAALFACAAPALAQQAKPASKDPIEITAKKSLEWHRDAKVYIARENAVAKQGTSELHGETLTAKYAQNENGGGTTITRIDAVGDVTVISDGSTATGARGYYDVTRGYSELTGGDLTLTTPTDKVTARDKLTYDAGKNEMNAYGDARAVRGDDVITSDRMIARFKKDPVSGESKMNEMEAIGNVVITTPTDVMHGDRGIYYAGSNVAHIFGNVRVDRGPTYITGARGEIDLNTNISRIFGETPASDGATPPAGANDAPRDGRVRGVFYPE